MHPTRPWYLSYLLGISLPNCPPMSFQVLKVTQLFCSENTPVVCCAPFYAYIYCYYNLSRIYLRHIADTHNLLNSQQVGKPDVHSFWGQDYRCEQSFIASRLSTYFKPCIVRTEALCDKELQDFDTDTIRERDFERSIRHVFAHVFWQKARSKLKIA